jgi:hypothetical protein
VCGLPWRMRGLLFVKEKRNPYRVSPSQLDRISKMEIPGRIFVGDILFVTERLKRVRVTRKVRVGVWEGIIEKTGNLIRFKEGKVHGKSPMSPLRPTVYPRAQLVGLHAGCGGGVYYSPTRRHPTRKKGERYCKKCQADGRYGRPWPVLDSEE